MRIPQGPQNTSVTQFQEKIKNENLTPLFCCPQPLEASSIPTEWPSKLFVVQGHEPHLFPFLSFNYSIQFILLCATFLGAEDKTMTKIYKLLSPGADHYIDGWGEDKGTMDVFYVRRKQELCRRRRQGKARQREISERGGQRQLYCLCRDLRFKAGHEPFRRKAC
jgi:hypothetical protein